MLAPASICMTASENIHSIAPQGRVETPSIPNTLLEIQHNYLSRGFQGGDCGCGCGCETYSGSGLGQLFSSGLDISQWGVGEYIIAGIGAYALFSMIYTSSKGASAVKSASQRRATKRKRIQELKEELKAVRSGKAYSRRSSSTKKVA